MVCKAYAAHALGALVFTVAELVDRVWVPLKAGTPVIVSIKVEDPDGRILYDEWLVLGEEEVKGDT